MFIRTKKIKKNNYAYLVKNKWTKKGARQKVSKYLGRVQEPERINETNYVFSSKESSAKEIIEDLIGWMLTNHGFVKNKRKWQKQDLCVNLASLKVTARDKNSVLKLGEDYLCSYNLRKLLRFRSTKGQEDVAIEFAKAFIQSGIPVPEEVFIHLFGIVYRPGQSYVK